MPNVDDDVIFCEECRRELPSSMFSSDDDICNDCAGDIEDELTDDEDFEFDEEDPDFEE